MQEVILVKNGELALKGLNRGNFESMMAKDIRRRIAPLGAFTVSRAQSTLTVRAETEGTDMQAVYDRICKVFGIAGICRAATAKKNMDDILRTAADYLAPQLRAAKTFKAEAKRADKKFPLKSPQICEEVGAYLLERFPHLRVDVHHPDVIVHIEVRDSEAYVHTGVRPGAGGMPAGSSGRAMLLVSGGIDSPVAGWMMAKRGVELYAVHFMSPPYTSERARKKVETLCEKVAAWSGRLRLFEVEFTKIQEEIRAHCPEELFTLVMRRLMMKIAGRLAEQTGCSALITGESIGQVASQTMGALLTTDAAVPQPVFRPLIGMDKEEIVTIARRIDTFETSILPYEDCCTVFTPRHPKTRPTLEEVEAAEARVDWSEMLQTAIDTAQVKNFTF